MIRPKVQFVVREREREREIRAVQVKTARNKGGKMAALYELCRDGKLDEVRAALACGGDVNDKDS